MNTNDHSTEDELRNKHAESSRGFSEASNYSLTVAIGIFAILIIFLTIDQVSGKHIGLLDYEEMNYDWRFYSKIILSISYFSIVLLGAVSFVASRIFSVMTDSYLLDIKSSYLNELKTVLNQYKLFRILNRIWFHDIINKADKDEKEIRIKAIVRNSKIFLVFYFVISISLWITIGLL
ncbi:MAG: hypothetical protein ACPKPY_01735 [Nitrososphaeraceae archaeon]